MELGLQILKQIQDLSLDRDIQGGDRLVGNNQAGPERQRAGNPDTLALAATEGVGEAPHVLGPEADAAEEIGYLFLALPTALDSVHQQGLPHEIEQRHAGIERGEGILEDHLHFPTQRSQLRPAQPAHIDHRATGDAHEDFPAGRLDGPYDASGGGRLPAAAFPDETEGLSFIDVKADAVHGSDMAHRPLQETLPDREELLEPGDAQQDLRG
jgi:hypothetical protein